MRLKRLWSLKSFLPGHSVFRLPMRIETEKTQDEVRDEVRGFRLPMSGNTFLAQTLLAGLKVLDYLWGIETAQHLRRGGLYNSFRLLRIETKGGWQVKICIDPFLDYLWGETRSNAESLYSRGWGFRLPMRETGPWSSRFWTPGTGFRLPMRVKRHRHLSNISVILFLDYLWGIETTSLGPLW